MTENAYTRMTPKFMPVEMVRAVVGTVLNTFMGNGNAIDTYLGRPALKRQACHIVVMVPSTEDARAEDFPKWPEYPITPHVLFEHSEGEGWSADYKNIARCKALQLWRNQNTDGNTDVQPHLLSPGDTVYWGGVKRHGIVVACSGVQPWFDQMIAGMIADAIKALGYELFKTSEEVAQGVSFLK